MNESSGRKGEKALYICHVYVPMNNSSVSIIEESFASLKENV